MRFIRIPLGERIPAREILISFAVFSTCWLATPAGATQSVVSYDGKRNLVNKDIGGERWTISRNLGDGTVTGNVFLPGGGAPSFIWCEDVTPAESTGDDAIYSCWGADVCEQAPCTVDRWTFLADVPLPRSFFEPDGEVEWTDIGAPATLPRSFFEPPEAGDAPADGGSGLQVTRDGARVLVSKDVGEERWAITRNLDDRTVTGNVFFAEGGDSAFLWCDETAATASEFTYACRIAEAVVLGPIVDGDGNYFVNQLIGDDDGEGTQAAPFQTIQGAIDALPVTGGRIYVAGGVYTAAPNDFDFDGDDPARMIVIDNRSRIELYGSFNPQTWIRDQEIFPSTIETGRRGIVIHESAAITIDGFTIRTDDATEPSRSAVGILLSESRAVTIHRNTILAGSGADGREGADGKPGRSGARGANGQNGAVCVIPPRRDGGNGGSGGDTKNSGGAGGVGNASAVGGSGSAGLPRTTDPFSALGGQPGAAGTDGADGDPGAGGSSPSLGVGTDVFAWTGSWGGTSQHGGGGGGGSGGAGTPPALVIPATCGGGGGGGGGGGERGSIGEPGQAGGSSIGISVGYESDAEIRNNRISTANGGAGGIGGLGGAGGAPGAGGSGGQATVLNAGRAGGNGGRGGAGGRGGDGGSGAGGSSIGIVLGSDETTSVVAEANSFELGDPGIGAMHPEAPDVTRGADGLREQLLDLRPDDESILF